MDQLCFNGNFYPVNTPLLTAQNQSYKWGEGLFETMKLHRNEILFSRFHQERMEHGLQVLQFAHTIDWKEIESAVLVLSHKNNCNKGARIRLSVFRDETRTNWIVEAAPLAEDACSFNKKGFHVDVYPQIRKATDALANCKTASYLPYVMAARYATQQQLDESLVLNVRDRICDASKANVFMVRGGQVFTPALSEGCVSGTTRKFLLQELPKMGLEVFEQPVSIDELATADEVFLTNAIYHMRWVERYGESRYSKALAGKIYQHLFATIYA